ARHCENARVGVAIIDGRLPLAHHWAAADGIRLAVRLGSHTRSWVRIWRSEVDRRCHALLLFPSRSRHPCQFASAVLFYGVSGHYGNSVWSFAGPAIVAPEPERTYPERHRTAFRWRRGPQDPSAVDNRSGCSDTRFAHYGGTVATGAFMRPPRNRGVARG